MTAARPTPWTAAQARAVLACDAVGALGVVGAAVAAREGDGLDDQLVWVNAAVLALLVVVVANGYLFLLARRAVGQRRLRLAPDVVADAPAPATTPDGPWLWLRGTTRAHLEGCPMIAGKPAKPIAPRSIRTKGLSRCEVCG